MSVNNTVLLKMKAIILHILLGALPVLAQVPQVGTPVTITTEKDTWKDSEYKLWRGDLKACGWTKSERFYSWSSVSIISDGEMKSVALPSYEKMTGFPEPDTKKLRPRGRDRIIGWDKEGRLIYSIFRVPLPTFSGKDPLHHLVYLEVLPGGMKVVKVEHEVGEWENGEWKKNNKVEQNVAE